MLDWQPSSNRLGFVKHNPRLSAPIRSLRLTF